MSTRNRTRLARNTRIRQLINIIKNRPGLSVDELSVYCDIKKTTIGSMLTKLAQEGKVVRKYRGNVFIFFPLKEVINGAGDDFLPQANQKDANDSVVAGE